MSKTTIWKKAVCDGVPSADVVELELPSVRDIIVLQLQGATPTIWFVADPDSPLETVRFHIVGTGNPMPNADVRYVGTWQLHGFVWHVFEEIE